uniref:Small ribosomal subunit protein uS11 n=1 Tax=candidate division CPR3 bacterium TaxID=2268181 RepID=A0A7C4M2X6_UNCC3
MAKEEEKIEKKEIDKKGETVEKTGDNLEIVEETPKKVKKKKKQGKNITFGNAYVKATFNNTIISITDLSGNVIASGSAGGMGYSGSKKSTPYVAGLIANSVATKAKAHGVADVNVFVKGIGSGRESAVRGLQSAGINIIAIKDITPLPHNGCRRPRTRRV